MPNLKLYSFFAGSGFLDLGFETAGFEIELVNEYSSSFMNAYQYARDRMQIAQPRFGYSNIDINEYLGVRRQELGHMMDLSHQDGNSLVGFIGGPPCPDFSIAGKQKGKDGKNGKLSDTYVKLITRRRPDFFLFENVKGLWSTAKHREYYDELKQRLQRAGYLMTDRLCNALEFGAPQDRDRILLFGVRRRVLQAHHLRIEDFNWRLNIGNLSLEQIKGLNWPKTEPFRNGGKTPCPVGLPIELTVQHWFDNNDVEHHPNANDYFTPRAGLIRMQTVEEGDDSKKSYKRLHRWRYSPTVAYGNNEVHLHPYYERRLSAAEALALQTLPSDFVLPPEMSLSDKFKTIGNGVPYVLAHGVAQSIFTFFNE